MAVEATHLNLFPSQLIQDRDLVLNPRNQGSAYNGQQMFFPGNPFVPTSSFYQPVVCDSVQAKTSANTDMSGLTCNNVNPRKRSINQLYLNVPPSQKRFPSSVVGEDMFHQSQMEIDAILSQHTKKIKLELEERHKQQARLLVTAFGEGVRMKLKEKEEEIQKMAKLNLFLQERVKSLYAENQMWRELAQTNEATANSLRTNLQQVIGGCEDDVQSSCGSSDHGGDGGKHLCTRCGERESCVLLLPCRHLCLCSVCGSGSKQLKSCPACNSTMNATLHVNMSS